MAHGPLEAIGAVAKHGIENRRRGAKDEQARKGRVDFARPCAKASAIRCMRGRLNVNSAE
jgi:hypothetical protein